MEKLPDSLLLQILSRLDDSADVARCRVALKAFNSVFPDLGSINLRCSLKWYNTSSYRVSKTVFLDLVSQLSSVESVCIGPESLMVGLSDELDPLSDEFYLTDGDFTKEWLHRVSKSLKSLSLSGIRYHLLRQTDVLPLISAYCHNLVTLELKFAWLSVHNLNPMPMLTSLTLFLTGLEDQHLNELNKCFPNLKFLKLSCVKGLTDPKIHLLKLQTCHWAVHDNSPSLTLIAPSLITLTIECVNPTVLHVEAPMLSHFHLELENFQHFTSITVKKFDNLKTLSLDCSYTGTLLSVFPISKTVENLTLDSGNKAPRDSKLTIGKVFTVFPNVSSICISSGAWSEIEACLNPEGWGMLDTWMGGKD